MYRIGQGIDLHRLAPGRPLRLGGIEIPSDLGPVSHSDGDVLLHAVTNALLGALGEGDIGRHFPDRDPRYRDADSARFVAEVLRRVHHAGYRVVNLDATVLAETPRLEPYRDAMVARISELLGVDAGCVNVKFGTGEGVGAVGRGEAIHASAVVLLEGPGRPS